MKGRFPIVAIAVVVIALVIALVVSGRSGARNGSELSGTIEAYEVQVASRVNARVIEVRCQEGQVVRAGDTLVLLDQSDYRNAALAAQAQSQAALANLSAMQ